MDENETVIIFHYSRKFEIKRSNVRYVNEVTIQYVYKNLDTLGHYNFLKDLKKMGFLNVLGIY